MLRAKARILATSSQSARTVRERPIFSGASKTNPQRGRGESSPAALGVSLRSLRLQTDHIAENAKLRRGPQKLNVRDDAVELADLLDLLTLEARLAQELFDARLAVEINI